MRPDMEGIDGGRTSDKGTALGVVMPVPIPSPQPSQASQ
jgi:hypothetical protein